ncbi:hypothetical protein [Pedococcus sp. P5_B7]
MQKLLLGGQAARAVETFLRHRGNWERTGDELEAPHFGADGAPVHIRH